MTDGNGVDRIRELNDALRCEDKGGQRHITAGIQALGEVGIARALLAVASFEEFTADNDPYGEHDCAVMVVDGVRVMWKIDYYDKSMTGGSPDPADPTVTERVITVMLASEY